LGTEIRNNFNQHFPHFNTNRATMNKLQILLLLFLFGSTNLVAQDGVHKVSKNYFRSDPFNSDFASFVKHILNDPTIKDKEFYQRSDTGWFYLHGFYSTHNPFFFKPTQVEVVLAETELKLGDTLNFKDTILLYQIVAYAEPTASGWKDAKREFEKIHKQIHKGFSSNNYQEQKTGGEVTAAWYNYFIPTHGVAPVTLMWGKTGKKDETVINITIRMKPSYNHAVLVAPLIQSIR
jgi:hypothetical protein